MSEFIENIICFAVFGLSAGLSLHGMNVLHGNICGWFNRCKNCERRINSK